MTTEYRIADLSTALNVPRDVVERIAELQDACRAASHFLEQQPEPFTYDEAFRLYQAREQCAAVYIDLAQAYRDLRCHPSPGVLRTTLSHAAAWADDAAHAISENALTEGQRFLAIQAQQAVSQP